MAALWLELWWWAGALLVLGFASWLGCRWARRGASALRCVGGRKLPFVTGGLATHMQELMRSIPLLWSESPTAIPPLGLAGAAQLAIFAFHAAWQEWRCDRFYIFRREIIPVELPGLSVGCGADQVALEWLLGRKGVASKELPTDAPVVILLPGLNCYKASLPGTSIYEYLLDRPWRVAVFEKRGVGPPGAPGLNAPVFHLFGHPSDLHSAVLTVQAHYPQAPIHIVGMSSGNGLASSYVAMYESKASMLKSCLLLIGGEDYNTAFRPPKGDWCSKIVFDKFLLEMTKERFLKRNEALLKQADTDGYLAALSAKTLQDFYDIAHRRFSGYTDPKEAEQRINAFTGGSCDCLAEVKVPLLIVFTEDDPVAPGGPTPSWVDVISKCENAALAMFPSGSHLGCYEGWGFRRWCDRLALQWLDAVSTSLV